MRIDEYAAFDGVGLAGLVAAGEVSAAELVECALAANEQVHDAINAVVAMHPPEADELPTSGPLRGVPTLAKDLFHGRPGWPCGNGSRLAPDWVVRYKSNLAARLDAAGLACIGRTTTSEFGILGTTETLAHGATRSPWSRDHIAGGSSGGAGAVVGAGVVPVALGSDGGGSIRIPAAACGVVGLKPTRGRVPWGAVTKEPLLGWAVQFALSRTVRDSAALLDVLAGPVPGDPFGLPSGPGTFAEAAAAEPRRLRIAWWAEPWSGHRADAEVVAATEATAELLESLGHEVVHERPKFSWDDYLPLMVDVWAATNAHTIDGLAHHLGVSVDETTLEPATLALVEDGRRVSGTRLLDALDHETWLAHVMTEFFGRHDVLLTPTLATQLPRIGEYDPNLALSARDTFAASANWDCFLPVFNTTGQPAISLPLHQSSSGLPIGMQLVGAAAREDLLLSLAGQLEQALPWGGRRPPTYAGA